MIFAFSVFSLLLQSFSPLGCWASPARLHCAQDGQRQKVLSPLVPDAREGAVMEASAGATVTPAVKVRSTRGVISPCLQLCLGG